jgi:hypothetical protein
MSKFQLEELESRHLLSSPGTLFQPPPGQALSDFGRSSMMIERVFFMDYDGYAGVLSGGWFDGTKADIILLQITFSGPVGREPVATGPEQQQVRAAWAEAEDGQVRVAADHFATRPGATGTAAAAFLINGAVPTVAADAPGSTRGVNVASTGAIFTILSERPDLQSRLFPGNLGSGGGLPAPLQNVPIQRSLSYAVPATGEPSGGPGRLEHEGAKLSNGSGTSVTAEQRDGSPLPSPQVSDVLAVLPPFDLSGLEVGMQELLKGLERLAPQLTGDRGGADLWPWIVALAAAAAACEIGRRELRRAPDLPTVETNGM